MSRRALITGATGFVGGHLAEAAHEQGWQLRALVRRTSDTAQLERLGVERVTGDLADGAAIADAASGTDVVFHLAAVLTASDEAGYIRANVDGTQLVVEAVASAAAPPRRFVYLSSYAACGPARNGHPRRLDETPEPLTAYGRTKLQGEEIVRTLEARGIEVVILRAPAVYGPRDRAFLPYFRLVKHGLAPAPSGAERHVHLIYAADLARALVRAASVAPGTYPVAEPTEHAWSEVVAEIARALGKRPLRLPLPPPLVRLAGAAAERVGDVFGGAGVFNREKAEEMLAPAWICDLSRSTALLSPDEAVPLAEGIARTAQWYRTQGWI